ncbi:MAG: PCYCGC domain-containing protein [Nitrospirota bacterium]|nr:PCYCGC domain-containing protein [Nitrospirota bacterium]
MRRTKLLLLLIGVSVMFSGVPAEAGQANLSGKYDQSLRKGETRATLNPGMFSEPTIREAYQAAKDIPWVLDSIYCYCQCAESPVFRHKSLLSCYVDKHAAM